MPYLYVNVSQTLLGKKVGLTQVVGSWAQLN